MCTKGKQSDGPRYVCEKCGGTARKKKKVCKPRKLKKKG